MSSGSWLPVAGAGIETCPSVGLTVAARVVAGSLLTKHLVFSSPVASLQPLTLVASTAPTPVVTRLTPLFRLMMAWPRVEAWKLLAVLVNMVSVLYDGLVLETLPSVKLTLAATPPKVRAWTRSTAPATPSW